MRLHIVATQFREFKRKVFNKMAGEYSVDDLLRLRMDYVSDLVACTKDSDVSISVAIANDVLTQARWVLDNNDLFNQQIIDKCRNRLDLDRLTHPEGLSWGDDEKWLYEVIAWCQIQEYNPDIILFTNVYFPSYDFRQKVIESGIKVALFCTQTLDSFNLLHPSHLVLTVSSELLSAYRAYGLQSELFSYWFNFSILDQLAGIIRKPEVIFVGQLDQTRWERRNVLARLAEKVPLAWYGPECDFYIADGALQNSYRGEAFGWEMYRALAAASVGFNHPPDFQPTLFGVIRTFEIFGVGLPMLMPERASHAPHFTAGRDFLTFETIDQAVTHCLDLLNDSQRAARIGACAQSILRENYSAEIGVKQVMKILRERLL